MSTETMPTTFRFLGKRYEDKFSRWECPKCKGEQLSHVDDGNEPPGACMLCTYRPDKKQVPLLEEVERILKNALHEKVVHFGAIAGPVLDVRLKKEADGSTCLLLLLPLGNGATGWYPYIGKTDCPLSALSRWKIEK